MLMLTVSSVLMMLMLTPIETFYNDDVANEFDDDDGVDVDLDV